MRARGVRKLGALILADRPLAVKPGEASPGSTDGIVRLDLIGFPWTDAAHQLLARVRFIRALEGEPWPDLSEATLTMRAGEWLAPMFAGKTAVSQVTGEDLTRALRVLPPALARRLEKELPSHLAVPTGSQLMINYAAEGGPVVSAVRVQELFGLTRIRGRDGPVPLTVRLAFAGGAADMRSRKDLPTFWAAPVRMSRAGDARALSETCLAH